MEAEGEEVETGSVHSLYRVVGNEEESWDAGEARWKSRGCVRAS